MLEIELDKPGDPHWLSKPVRKFDPDQPRDDQGQWSEFGAAGGHAWTKPAAKDFIAARDKNPRADFFSHLTAEDLADNKLIMNEAGTAGASVDASGDIQNVFRNPGAPPGAGTQAAKEAVRQGGFMLDAYDYETPGKPGLPDIYRKAGFVETGRMKFNPAYRPNWPAERKPDVVFMAYKGGDQSSSPKATNYYAAHEWDKAKKDSLAHADAPGESDVARQLREENERRRATKPEIPPTVDRALHGLGKAAMSGADKESMKIRENKKKWGLRPHRFLAAEWTHPNGHPRCIRCGDDDPIDGLCMPELLKYAAMLDAALGHGRIESQGEAMSKGNWIAQFHSACITKGAPCSVKWPVCPAKKTAVEKDATPVEKYIREEDGKFNVYSEAGKRLGSHATRAEAAAQLRAIEANKAAAPLFEPSAAAMKALQAAFRTYAKAEGIVVKREEVLCEAIEKTDMGDVYRIEYGTGHAFFIEKDGGVERLALYTQRKHALVPIAKDEKQRYTLGVVYAPGEMDYHGDTMTEVELEKAAWAFAQKEGLTSRVGMMHQSGTEGSGRVVESYIYRGPVWKVKDVTGKEQTIVPGSWMLGAVWESDAWTKVENGKLTGYSLQGVARKFANGEEV